MGEPIQERIMAKVFKEWVKSGGKLTHRDILSRLEDVEKFVAVAILFTYKVEQNGLKFLYEEEFEEEIAYLIDELNRHRELPAFGLVADLLKDVNEFVEAFERCPKAEDLYQWFVTGIENYTVKYNEHCSIFLDSLTMVITEKERA